MQDCTDFQSELDRIYEVQVQSYLQEVPNTPPVEGLVAVAL